MTEDLSGTPREHRREQARRTLAFAAAALAGGLFAIVVVAIVAVVAGRGRLPAVTRERLAAAVARWQQAGPDNYDLEVRVSARQTEVHRVEVRDGQVRRYTRNGRPMKRRRTFGTWTVPGMFSTIERDLKNVQLVAQGKSGPTTPRLTLWGTFHPRYGYPQQYRRVQWGSGTAVSWQVTHFSVVEQHE